jgi:hypothetical protein
MKKKYKIKYIVLIYIMGEDIYDKVIHNLTHRRFKNTSRRSAYELGTSVSNSFYDPRNIGNFDAGEIDPEGRYAVRYPVNSGSNTAGFSFGLDVDKGNDRQIYSPSVTVGNVNALQKGSGLGGGSSGSASDYQFFNPYYQALLNPKGKAQMQDIASPHYEPYVYVDIEDGRKVGRGTNAPSSGSYIDYNKNNPYAFTSNFSGGALGAASSGSSSDYYSSNPNRVPAIQSETRHYTDFMEGGAINWAKYFKYLKTGIQKAPKIIKTTKDTLNDLKEIRDLLGLSKKEKKDMRGRGQKKGKKGKKSKMPMIEEDSMSDEMSGDEM